MKTFSLLSAAPASTQKRVAVRMTSDQYGAFSERNKYDF